MRERPESGDGDSTYLQPRYHLRPARNWMNDPNGPIFWKGRYRMFYQYNPTGALWGNIHWAYAESADMVRWKRHRALLAPGPGAYDSGGVFSGCAMAGGGRLPGAEDELLLYYTAAEPQAQCLAFCRFGDDGEPSFRKHPANPLIPWPPEPFRTPDFRDPFVWSEAGPGGHRYRMILASGQDGRGLVFSYHSPDGQSWVYDGIFYEETLPPGIPAFECPFFFSLSGTDYLAFTPFAPARYLRGRAEAGVFRASGDGVFDPNPGWYAPNTFLAADGRRIVIGWLREERPDRYLRAEGWAGCLSLPRELFVHADGGLCSRPAAEVETLRSGAQALDGGMLRAGADRQLLDGAVQGELALTLRRGRGSAVKLSLFRSGPLRAICLISDDEVILDPSGASAAIDVRPAPKRLSLESFREDLELRIFLDRSVIEVYADGSRCVSSRVYPDSPEQGGVAISVVSGAVELLAARFYPMEDAL